MDDQRQILTYTLQTELGHDRLGRVFRAVDTRTLRPVVVRILRVGGLVPAERVEAVRVELRRHLRAAANVAHPNIAQITDIASYSDLELVAWDDLGGRTLADRLLDGAPAAEALRWAIETASAVARAHSRDVPHGRISLANIHVGRDDSVRVLDLGVPRPNAVPFLVEEEPDSGGALRPARRRLGKLMRRDLEALAGVVREIVATGPPHAADATIREQIAEAVSDACAAVLAMPRPTVAQLHLALIEVARRTPTDSRRSRLLEIPAARPAFADPEGDPGTPMPPPGAADPLPFALADYENTKAGRLRRAGPPETPPLKVWGAAAFELEKEQKEVEEVVALDPNEPPLMTTVMLPPVAPGGPAFRDDEENEGGRRVWPQLLLAVIIGMLLAVGLFTLDQALRGPGRQPVEDRPLAARDGSALPDPPIVRDAPPALAPGPRPVARPGQPAGTLVVTATQPDVQVSVDGSRAEGLPVTWENVPAGQRVLRITAPGFQERIDTVQVRPNLTTTRYYVLTPVR